MERFTVILKMKEGHFEEFNHREITRKKLKQWFKNIMNFRLDFRSPIYDIESIK